MEFSILYEGQPVYPTSRQDERALLKTGVEVAELADNLDFDCFYSVEHHTLDGYSCISAPECLLSYVAARTERIRVGHGVCCLPFKMNHPVRVAERVAMLDILSGGRVNLGVGRSSSRQEQETFGIDTDPAVTTEQMVDSLRAMVKYWTTEEPTAYHSDILDIPLRKIMPRPVQQPHPRLSMACNRLPQYERAGQLGIGIMSNAIDGPNQAAHKIELYEKGIAAQTPESLISAPIKHFGATVFTTVLDDADEARRIGLRGMRYFLESAMHFFGAAPPPAPDTWSDNENIDALFALTAPKDTPTEAAGLAQGLVNRPARSEAATGVDDIVKEDFIIDWADPNATPYGTASDTIHFVEQMFDQGVDEVYFVLQTGTIPHEAVIESVRQIGEKVIPHFRKAR